MRQARKTFVRGPFHLGRFSLLVGWVATLWVAFITVVFVLPTAYPVTKENFNYSPVGVLKYCWPHAANGVGWGGEVGDGWVHERAGGEQRKPQPALALPCVRKPGISC